MFIHAAPAVFDRGSSLSTVIWRPDSEQARENIGAEISLADLEQAAASELTIAIFGAACVCSPSVVIMRGFSRRAVASREEGKE